MKELTQIYNLNNGNVLKILENYFGSERTEEDKRNYSRKIFTLPPVMYFSITRNDVVKIVKVASKIDPNYPTIIDVGCGTGAVSALVYRESEPYGKINVIGFDPNYQRTWNEYKFGRLGFVEKSIREIPEHFYPEAKEEIDEIIKDVETLMNEYVTNYNELAEKTKDEKKKSKWAVEELRKLRKYYVNLMKEFWNKHEEKVDVAILSWPPQGFNPMMYVPLINPKVVIVSGHPDVIGENIKCLHRDENGKNFEPRKVRVTIYNTFSTLGLYEVVSAKKTPSFVTIHNKVFNNNAEGIKDQIVLVMAKPEFADKVKEVVHEDLKVEGYPWDDYTSDGLRKVYKNSTKLKSGV